MMQQLTDDIVQRIWDTDKITEDLVLELEWPEFKMHGSDGLLKFDVEDDYSGPTFKLDHGKPGGLISILGDPGSNASLGILALTSLRSPRVSVTTLLTQCVVGTFSLNILVIGSLNLLIFSPLLKPMLFLQLRENQTVILCGRRSLAI